MRLRRLAECVALVTGAGRGIGRCIALQLADEGAKVVINDLDDGPASETAELVAASGGEALTVAGSVTEPAFAERFIDEARSGFGRIDIVVNNAGYSWNGRIEATSDEQWNAMLDVHLTAPFRVARAVVRHWKASPLPSAVEGPRSTRKIVNVCSISGTHGAVGQIGYSAAKAGLIGLTRSLARELGPDGVNVNAVAFGFIETRLTQEIDGETSVAIGTRRHRVGITGVGRDDLRSRTPLRRSGSPEEAAGAVVLLCLPQADFVTGQVVEVDGGLAL